MNMRGRRGDLPGDLAGLRRRAPLPGSKVPTPRTTEDRVVERLADNMLDNEEVALDIRATVRKAMDEIVDRTPEKKRADIVAAMVLAVQVQLLQALGENGDLIFAAAKAILASAREWKRRET
jgi:hypothetical protein